MHGWKNIVTYLGVGVCAVYGIFATINYIAIIMSQDDYHRHSRHHARLVHSLCLVVSVSDNKTEKTHSKAILVVVAPVAQPLIQFFFLLSQQIRKFATTTACIVKAAAK